MTDLAEYVDGLPNICGSEERIRQAMQASRTDPVFLPQGASGFGEINSAFAIALHMHQPLIPAGSPELRTAQLISNVQWMLDNPDIGDNHNARVFLWCYRRMGEFVPHLLDEGFQPRVMLDYSGTLLSGLRQMGASDVLDALVRLTGDERTRRAVEWLGCPWGHAVAPSTPVQDYRLHVEAWQHHFAAIFGLDALRRVRGFSPSEMALPNQPDVAYEFVKTLIDCGYQWVLVLEHTIEQPDGQAPQHRHLPHRLVCTNSRGDTATITAVIKTQGSDTELIGECSGSGTPIMNVTEYLERLESMGVHENDLPVIQPLFQARIWERMVPGDGPERLAEVIKQLRAQDGRFHMEGGSWTNNLSWIQGYDKVLVPMERASSLFHQRITASGIQSFDPRYRNALFHLLTAETSCYRYWGEGIWTDYGTELSRRVSDIVTHNQ